MPSLLSSQEESPLFQPVNAESSATFRFLRRVNSVHGLDLQSYLDLYKWSTAHLDAFWGMVWDETNVIGDKASHVVDNDALPLANPVWYAYFEHGPCFLNDLRVGLRMHKSTGLRIC
jgi:acetoacetyl-CoA synthetase